jgi:cell division cycle 2-like
VVELDDQPIGVLLLRSRLDINTTFNVAMSGAKSRWADSASDETRRREKEEKKRAKADKQKRQEAEAAAKKQRIASAQAERPPKRRRLSNEDTPNPKKQDIDHESDGVVLLQFPHRGWGPARHADSFERLNHIDEGSYGWVSRARDMSTGEVVALKKLKMDNPGEGFPITALREIQALKVARHRHVVNLIEVVVGKTPLE